jgi:hypothetical protein
MPSSSAAGASQFIDDGEAVEAAEFLQRDRAHGNSADLSGSEEVADRRGNFVGAKPQGRRSRNSYRWIGSQINDQATNTNAEPN